jgi:CheY-like chemotaxis protein
VSLSSAGRNHGTLVTITLPAAASDERRPPADESASPSRSSSSGLRVLVVEDNADARESFEMLLTLDGHQVCSAATGVKTLRLLDAFKPDAAFIDLGLPDMDGYELAKRLRADPRTASVHLIALSGYGREEDKEACRQAGFDVHLTKPVSLDTVREVLANRRRAEPMGSRTIRSRRSA